MTTSP